jgi:poly(glycerol-phosphate) alpha-glucosyltransferase
MVTGRVGQSSNKKSRADEDIGIYFLNLDIRPQMAGIEISALNRTKVFGEIGLKPIILTIGFNNSLHEHASEVVNKNRAISSLAVESIYDYYLYDRSWKPAKLDINYFKNHKCIPVPQKNTDVRLYDLKGNIVGYCRRNEGDLSLSYVNYLWKGKIFKRETFDSRGFCSRTEVMHPKNDEEENVTDSYHRPSGMVALFKESTVKKNVATCNYIAVNDEHGSLSKVFTTDSEWVSFWIESISTRHSQVIFIVDRCNELFVPALNAKRKFPNKVKLIPVLHGVHAGIDPLAGETNLWYKSAIENLSYVDKMVVLTDDQKKDIEERYDLSSGKLVVIPHSCDSNQRPLSESERRKNRVVYVARFSPEKNHITALEIFKKVITRHPSAELVFYGFGQTEEKIREKIKELDLEKSVKLMPFNQDIKKIYHEATFSILTSFVEGFCQGVLESLSYGCPVVSFNIKYGPSSMIKNDINGYLVKPGDQAAFADKCSSILSDPNLAQTLSNNCSQSVAHYSHSEISRRWSAMFDKLNVPTRRER